MQKFISSTLILLSLMLLIACEKESNVTLRLDCGEYSSSDTQVTVNKITVGECPLTIKVQAGQLYIEAHRDYPDNSYRHAEQSITVTEHEIKELKFDFPKLQYGTNIVVTDKENNLMWMQCSLGQVWNNETVHCEGKVVNLNWHEAKVIAKESNYAGYNDWRVPTIEELESLVYCNAGKKDLDSGRLRGCREKHKHPTINQVKFPDTPYTTTYFWSSSVKYSNEAWYVNFREGNSYSRDKDKSTLAAA